MGSNIWDGLDDTFHHIIKLFSKGRRTAIVHMTDGHEVGSQLAFASLLENVRGRDTTIFPIHLDDANKHRVLKKFTRRAYRTLRILAEETGGRYHHVKNIEDLAGVYEKIANELRRVYSLGYEPKNEKLDGSWRKITLTIKNRPDLIVRTKKGYYAK